MQQIEPVRTKTLMYYWNVVWLEESNKVDNSKDFEAWRPYYLSLELKQNLWESK